MVCGSCSAELLPGKAFCHACGARAEIRCANCGARLEPRFRFCPDCGHAVGAAPAPAAEPTVPPPDERLARLTRHIPEGLAQKIRGTQAPAGERKLVTVLFCDLVGSTAIAEGLDPEEYRDLLDQYLELAFQEIYRYEGIVNQLAGDGMMALFGAPIAHEDAPYRAVRAACEIQKRLAVFNGDAARGRSRLTLSARLGINTGPVVVGTVGNDLKMDYTAIGDTTNLAARLQSLAEPSTILISDSTHRLVRGFFEVTPEGPFEIKGKSEPVTAYRVLGVSEISTAMAAAEARGLTPLVRREQELSQLMGVFERVREHLPQVVAVVGDAGSGKSRLLYEFKNRIAAEPLVLFEGRCSSLTQSLPYAPFVAMFRQYFELDSRDTPSCSCDKIAAKVRPFDPDLEHMFPFLCRMMSVETDGIEGLPADEIKRETFQALARLVVGVAEQSPVIISIEDLHWIDEASRELLELAVAQLTRARVMIVVSHRPDYEPTWRAQVAFTQLTLRPLADAEVRAIVRSVAGSPLPAALEQLVLTKAEGSPFFAEEITRALLEEGYLVRDGDSLNLTRPVEEILIPGTVREVIAARLDRLGGDAKRVAQVASLLGRQFRREQLAALLAPEDVAVTRALAELEHRGIIHRKNALSADEFRFGESLTQEVAYDGLLLKERRALHERVAEGLEGESGDAGAERLTLVAHHYARSANPHKAISALHRAAQRAEKLPSYRTAADYYRRAWELADAALEQGRGADSEMLRLAMTTALDLCRVAVVYTAPDDVDIGHAARRGRELAEGLGDKGAVASFYAFEGMITMSVNRHGYAEGHRMLERAYQLARSTGRPELALQISRGLAFSYFFDGRFDEAQGIAEGVIESLEAAGGRQKLPDFYFGVRWARQTILFHRDDLDAAAADAAEMLELALRANNRTTRSGASAFLARIHFLRGEYAEARRWADQGFEVAEAIGNFTTMRTAASTALAARVALGEKSALDRYVRAIEQSLSMTSNLSLYIRPVAMALLDAGELSIAERAARLGYDHAGGRLRDMLATEALAEVMHAFGPSRAVEAAEHNDRALTLARDVGSRSGVALALLLRAELAAEAGALDSERPAAEQALAIFTELGFERHRRRAARLLLEAAPATPSA